MASVQKRQLMVVSHSHWDREWYLPFEGFRARLVSMLDRLLHLLETNPDYKYFMLDGQSIILEDYLEIRPDRRQDIARQVQAGRLLVGPWYVLADEFLVGGVADQRGDTTQHRVLHRSPVRATDDGGLPAGHVWPDRPHALHPGRLRHPRRRHLAGSR